jgi:hypothetical protein
LDGDDLDRIRDPFQHRPVVIALGTQEDQIVRRRLPFLEVNEDRGQGWHLIQGDTVPASPLQLCGVFFDEGDVGAARAEGVAQRTPDSACTDHRDRACLTHDDSPFS